MTNLNPSSILTDYLDSAHSEAVQLNGLICALAHLENEGNCPDGVAAITQTIYSLSQELVHRLDSIERPVAT